MAAGAGFGGIVTALLPLIGVVTMVRARNRRRRGVAEPVDEDLEARKAATRETERRMASYLAGRDAGRDHRSMDE